MLDEPMDVEDTMMAEAEATYSPYELDEMLDGLVFSEDADLAERRAKRGRGARGGAPQRGVPAARGGTAYRSPAAQDGAAVTQKQLKDALARVGADVRRNAEGIKTLTTRVNDVVAVNTVQSRLIGALDKRMRIDGALELVEAYNGTSIDAYQLLKGAVKSGFLGEGKGALGNPLVIGGIGLLLRNPGGILGGLVQK